MHFSDNEQLAFHQILRNFVKGLSDGGNFWIDFRMI